MARPRINFRKSVRRLPLSEQVRIDFSVVTSDEPTEEELANRESSRQLAEAIAPRVKLLRQIPRGAATKFRQSVVHSKMSIRQEIPLMEQRFLWFLLTELKSEQYIRRGRIHDADLALTFHYTEIVATRTKEIAETVADAVLNYKLYYLDNIEQGERRATDVYLVIFKKLRFNRVNGFFEIVINQEALPFLLDLSGGFAEMTLEHGMRLPSSYAQRLYAYFCRSQAIKKQRIELLQLKQLLRCEHKKLTNGNFKADIIDRAVAQINNCTDLSISCSPVYDKGVHGTPMSAIEFIIVRQSLSADKFPTASLEGPARAKAIRFDVDDIMGMAPQERRDSVLQVIADSYPSFTSMEALAIVNTNELTVAFIRAELYVLNSSADNKIQDREAYVRKSVFYPKNPHPPYVPNDSAGMSVVRQSDHEFAEFSEVEDQEVARPRGRPKGSKNKPKD